MDDLRRLLSYFNIYIGRWVGVPVTLHWSWVLLFSLFLLLSPALAAIYVGVFLIILLHECGHCIAARRCGVERIESIILYPIGGAASMAIPPRAGGEAVIALAGPAVNVALMGVFWLIGDCGEILSQIALANVCILLFNLIPAFPMDGGRVLRATLFWRMRHYVKATLWATRVSAVLCVLGFVAGLVTGQLMLLVIAPVIFMAGQQELAQAEERQAYEDSQQDRLDPRVQESLEALRRAGR
jgi:Zn-dependent protease